MDKVSYSLRVKGNKDQQIPKGPVVRRHTKLKEKNRGLSEQTLRGVSKHLTEGLRVPLKVEQQKKG